MGLALELLETLCCPVERSPLRVMTAAELGELNDSIAGGGARYRHGERVPKPLEGALAAQAGTAAYSIKDGVPQLLPRLGIVRSAGAAAVAPELPTTAGPKSFADIWEDRSLQWPKIGPPLRPAPQDVELCQRITANALAEVGSPVCRALLLGVTPEVATMQWRKGSHLLGLDFSPAMIRNVWPRNAAVDAAVALADWTAMPVRDETYDIVISDGSFNMMTYPDQFFALARESRRVVRDGGTLVTRVFARPETPDAIDRIFADLRHGRLREFGLFRWRLAMALHGDLLAGTRFGDMWDAWHANVPDPHKLARDLGWGPHDLEILESYKGAEFRNVFPTVREFHELFADGFDAIACHVPEYPDGDRYPTLVFRARPC